MCRGKDVRDKGTASEGREGTLPRASGNHAGCMRTPTESQRLIFMVYWSLCEAARTLWSWCAGIWAMTARSW